MSKSGWGVRAKPVVVTFTALPLSTAYSVNF